MISKDTVSKIAKLAKLELTEDQIEMYRGQMEVLLKYFEELQEISTEGVEPLTTPVAIEAQGRVDEVKTWINVEETIKNGPAISGRLFKVPPVV